MSSNNPALDQALMMLNRLQDLDAYDSIHSNLLQYGSEISVEGLKTIGMQLFMIWKDRDNGEKVNNCLEVITSTINNRGLDIPGAVDENGKQLCPSTPVEPFAVDEEDDEDDEDDEDWEEDEDDEEDGEWDEDDEEEEVAPDCRPKSRPVLREKAPVISAGKIEIKRQPIVSVNGWIFNK